ncbi:hypothetical protein EB796_022467 [Bugula neritina]|uniref:RING-type E3 ubiquitin transferase n=1 Tax=Bugula neritina TaxID=10212 RepID=A0A7J7J0I6_BUGNE|nr:hypothetical protein EB796_022467 [Bugula neritina]
MGQIVSNILNSNDENVQEVAISNSNAYKWPPKAGNYFGSHFIMGGERFDSQPPEAFLFGENSDLNFLGSRPMPFPYPTPQLNEPTRTLRSLVNIRKDTVRLIRCESEETAGAIATTPEVKEADDKDSVPSVKDADVEAGDAAPPQDHSTYNIEFVFDSDATCKITILYFATEEVVNGVAVYAPKEVSLSSDSFSYKRGANQTFSQPSHVIKPSDFSQEQWSYSVEKDEIPIVIHCTVENEPEYAGHSHVTFCVLEHLNDGYHIKVIKQKQCVDGLLYILQEFYGIENKESDSSKQDDDDEFEDNTDECVICMSDIRDTLILPCRHLCLCNGCADSLRYQANNCPICRAPFRALLQIRAIRKKGSKPDSDTTNGSDEEDEVTVSQRGVPSGYEAISLIEALNGPFPSSAKPADSKAQRIQSQGSLRRSKKSKKKDHKGSRMNLKDKNKDKDYIASEEKEAESKEKEAESKEKEAESKEKEAESKEKEAESKEKEAESKENDANTKQKDDNGDQIPQATKHSSVDESLPPKYDETFVQTVKPLTEEVNKQTVPPLPSPPKLPRVTLTLTCLPLPEQLRRCQARLTTSSAMTRMLLLG